MGHPLAHAKEVVATAAIEEVAGDMVGQEVATTIVARATTPTSSLCRREVREEGEEGEDIATAIVIMEVDKNGHTKVGMTTLARDVATECSIGLKMHSW